jgi:hypothetical protein
LGKQIYIVTVRYARSLESLGSVADLKHEKEFLAMDGGINGSLGNSFIQHNLHSSICNEPRIWQQPEKVNEKFLID